MFYASCYAQRVKHKMFQVIIYVVIYHTVVCVIRRQNDLKTIFICLSSTVNSLPALMAACPSQANMLEPTFAVMECRYEDYHAALK